MHQPASSRHAAPERRSKYSSHILPIAQTRATSPSEGSGADFLRHTLRPLRSRNRGEACWRTLVKALLVVAGAHAHTLCQVALITDETVCRRCLLRTVHMEWRGGEHCHTPVFHQSSVASHFSRAVIAPTRALPRVKRRKRMLRSALQCVQLRRC